MPAVKKRANFFESEEGVQVRQTLLNMVENGEYHTVASYSANAIIYPDNVISFVDKHMKYLSEHQAVNVDHYLSNLRLMTRIK